MPMSEALKVSCERFRRGIYAQLHAQVAATKLFNTCVNTGHYIFQRTVAACGQRIVIDGAVAPWPRLYFWHPLQMGGLPYDCSTC